VDGADVGIARAVTVDGMRAWRSASAPAKVNLGLAVTGTRPDGYHELRSIFLRVGLADELLGSVDKGLSADRLRIEGANELDPAEDIVLRAVGWLRRDVGRRLPPLDLVLRKRIPVAAGLGGGSSDGAAALSLACELWSLDIPSARLAHLSADLGADMPFFSSSLAVASVGGVGESLEALPRVRGDGAVLLVTPNARLSTKDVFKAFDRVTLSHSRTVDFIDRLAGSFRAGINGAALAALASSVRDANDLWSAALALEPSLGPLRDHLEQTLGRSVLFTGSGSTLFALYPSHAEADEGARRLTVQANRPPISDTRLIAAVPLTSDT
jgi:4-diphosphocytidyl-2-C-methyl-D-erythritol kinase